MRTVGETGRTDLTLFVRGNVTTDREIKPSRFACGRIHRLNGYLRFSIGQWKLRRLEGVDHTGDFSFSLPRRRHPDLGHRAFRNAKPIVTEFQNIQEPQP